MAKISSYPNNGSPDNAFEFLGTDPSNTSEGPTGTTETVTLSTLKSVIGGAGGGGGLVDWKDLVGTYSADPTGATSSSTALANACSAAVSAYPAPFGLTVPPGNYLMTQGQLLPGNLIMAGAGANGGTVTHVFNGTTFTISSSFNPSAGYLFGITATANETAVNGPILSGFGINGAAYTAEAVDGISITGPAFTVINLVNIVQTSGWGINSHALSTASPIGADGMVWDGLTIDSCVSGGVRLIYGEDSQISNVYIIGCGGDGWQLAGCDNTHFTNCRAEWNGNYGWHVTNISDGGNTYDWTYATGYVMFTGCSTDANTQSGFRVDASWQTGQGSGTGPCVVQVNGPCFRRDGIGNNGAVGSWAGIDVNYSAVTSGNLGLPVYVQGPVVTTGPGDVTASMSPRYGVIATSTGAAPFRLTGGGLVMGFSAGSTSSGTVTNYSIASTIDTFAGDNYNYTG